MTTEANRLSGVAATIKAGIDSVRTMLDVAERHLESKPVNWLELTQVLYRAQSALFAPASLAHEETQ